MLERFTDAARGVVALARDQARELGHPSVGTEHLLLALLDPAAGITAVVLREAGVDAGSIRSAVVRHVAGLRPQSPPLTDDDAEALRSIGIDLEAVLARLEETLGADALTVPCAPAPRRGLLRRRSARPPGGGHIAFSARAKKVLELAVREAVARHSRSIGSEHLLLGLLREGRGLAAQVLAETGADLGELRRATERALDDAA